MKTSFELFAAENRRIDNRLKDQDYMTYDKIMASLNPVRMGKVRSEMVRRDLLDLVLAARDKSETLEQRLGENAHTWSSEVQQANGMASRQEMVLEVCYQVLGFFTAMSSIAALISACVFQLPSQLIYPVTLNLEFFLNLLLIGGAWALYSVVIAPRMAARHGISAWLRFVILIVLLSVADWGMGIFQYDSAVMTGGMTMPWGVMWAGLCAVFGLVALYRRKKLNDCFLSLTGERERA